MSLKGAELIRAYVTIILNINMKAYIGSPLMRLHLTLVTLKGQWQGHSGFEICKGTELGHMLLLNTNRKSYMRSLITLSHLT